MNTVAGSKHVVRKLFEYALMLTLSLLLVACGGGGGGSSSTGGGSGGGGGGADTTPPTVLGTSPDFGVTNVGRSAIVVAVFSENLDVATVNNSSFTLTGGSGAVTGMVSFDASTRSARFVPDTPLDPLTTYTATLASTITDVAGNALTVVNWSFTTGDKGWGNAVMIDNASTDSVTPRMAMDAAGNAMVVWEQDGYIWFNRFKAGSGWGTPAAVYSNPAVYAWKPEVAVASNGDAIAVWQQGEPNNIGTYHYHVLASYYTAATASWGAPQYLGDTPVLDAVEDAYEPDVAMDSTGNALVVWTQTDNTHGDLDVWANRFQADGGGWQGAGLVDGDTATVGELKVAFDAGGNALVVWSDSTFPTVPWSAVWAKRYEPAGTGWQATVSLGSSTDEALSAPQLAIDASGNAIVVWQQFNSTPWLFSVWANRYQAGTSAWSGAQLLEHDDVGDHSDPAIAMDPDGNAMAVWEYNDHHIVGIQASRYVQATDSWTTPEDINARVGNAMVPSVAMDSSGNAIAVWVEGDINHYFSLWTNRYVPGSGWGTIELVEYNDGDVGGTGMWPQIAIDDTDGSAIAVWAQDTTGSRSEIWANRFE